MASILSYSGESSVLSTVFILSHLRLRQHCGPQGGKNVRIEDGERAVKGHLWVPHCNLEFTAAPLTSTGPVHSQMWMARCLRARTQKRGERRTQETWGTLWGHRRS